MKENEIGKLQSRLKVICERNEKIEELVAGYKEMIVAHSISDLDELNELEE